MANGVRKYAIVLGGSDAVDTPSVAASLKALKAGEFETFVANPERPSEGADHFYDATREGLRTLVKDLKGRIDGDDELVIYAAGHGSDYRVDGDGESAVRKGSYCLTDGCDYQEISSLLDGIRYGSRTVIMSQCYSGNWARLFLDDPKTLFISSTDEDQVGWAGEVMLLFWSEDVKDENGDGKIAWWERFAHAVADRAISSAPIFRSSAGYRDIGGAPFADRALEVKGDELGERLKSLRPGQYAAVTFSTDWCGACKGYRPKFEQMAKESGGRYLWLWTEDEDLGAEWGVKSWPTVVVVDWAGRRSEVSIFDRERVLKDLDAGAFGLPPGERLKAIFEGLLGEVQEKKGSYAGIQMGHIADVLARAPQWRVASGLFDELAANVDRIPDVSGRTWSLRDMARAAKKAEHVEMASSMLRRLITSARAIPKPERGAALLLDLSASVRSGLAGMAGRGMYEDIASALKGAVASIGGDVPQKERADVVIQMMGTLSRIDDKELAAELYGLLADAASSIEDPAERSTAFARIAAGAKEEGLAELAKLCMGRAIEAIGEVEGEESRRVLIHDRSMDLKSAALGTGAAFLFRMLAVSAEGLSSGNALAILMVASAMEAAGLGGMADEAFEEGMRRMEGSGDDAAKGSAALRDAGNYLSYMQLDEGAGRLYWRAFHLAMAAPPGATVGKSLDLANRVAGNMASSEMKDDALSAYRQMAASAEAIEDRDERILAMKMVGLWTAAWGFKEEAKDIFQRAIEDAKAGDPKEAAPRLIELAAAIFYAELDLDVAGVFRQAIEVASLIEEEVPRERMYVVLSAARKASSLGLLGIARDILAEGLKAARGCRTEDKSTFLSELGAEFVMAGAKAQARKIFGEAIEAAGTIEEDDGRAYAIREAADEMGRVGLKEEAHEAYRTAIAACDGADEPRGVRCVYIAASIAQGMHRYGFREEATEIFARLAAIAKDIRDPRRAVSVYIDLAYYLEESSLREKAREVLDLAMGAAKDIGEPIPQAWNYLRIGRGFAEAGEKRGARAAFSRSAAIAKGIEGPERDELMASLKSARAELRL